MLDTVYPSARDYLAFPELIEANVEPWKVSDVYLFQFTEVQYYVDISSTIKLKVESLSKHYSQYDNFSNLNQVKKIPYSSPPQLIPPLFSQSVYNLAQMVAKNTASNVRLAEGYRIVPQLP